MPDVKEALTRPIGPLPAWGWGVAIGGGFLAYHFLKTGSLFSGGNSGSSNAAPSFDSGFGTSDYPPYGNPLANPTSGGGQIQADPGSLPIIPFKPPTLPPPTHNPLPVAIHISPPATTQTKSTTTSVTNKIISKPISTANHESNTFNPSTGTGSVAYGGWGSAANQALHRHAPAKAPIHQDVSYGGWGSRANQLRHKRPHPSKTRKTYIPPKKIIYKAPTGSNQVATRA